MKRYSVARARERLADVLNEVDRNGSVVIERRNIQYVIRVNPARRRPRSRRQSVIETIDPAVSAGQWRWVTTASGVRFARPRT